MYYYVEKSARSGRIICEGVSQFLRGRVADISRQGRKYFEGAARRLAFFSGGSFRGQQNAAHKRRRRSSFIICYQISSTMT